MVNKYKGFKSEKMAGPREKLPAGGYVAKIMGAKVEDYSWGQSLIVSYDITEGEYAGFFKRDRDNNGNADRRWRGNLRMNVPKGDGSEQDAWTVRSFNNFIASVEDSNPAFAWDWDETKLKGKEVGMLVRNREYEINGTRGWTTEASSTTDTASIRSGKFRIPKDKPLKTQAEHATGYNAAEDDSDLPF